eukprot:14633493-Heterocapsa_arctica.AAC.1
MDTQHRVGRDMSYGQYSYKHRGEHKQSTLMAQTREHHNKMHIGYIMFEELGNKHSASRSQAGTHTYCMENKQPDNLTKVNDKSKAGRY